MNIEKLSIKNQELVNVIIDPILNDNKDIYDFSKPVLVFNTIPNSDFLEIMVALLGKQDFIMYLQDKKDPLYGCLMYGDITIMVYGLSSEKYFDKTNETVALEFLTTNMPPKNNWDESEIPDNFEFEVRKYMDKQNCIRLLDVDYYNLLR